MNWHDFLIIETSWNKHRGMTWLNYITDTSQNKHQGTIHKIYRWIHSEVTNTLTLPLNYEGILSTQFFSTGLLLWIILSSASSSHLHLQVIFIFNSSLNSSHLYLQVIFILIWIITGSGSSSLDLDHHSMWIITAGSSLLDLDQHSI